MDWQTTAQRSMSRTMCPGVKSLWDRFRKVAHELTKRNRARRLVVGTLPVESAVERSVLKQRGGINGAGLWIGSLQAESLLLTQAATNDSTPDETAVSNELDRSRRRLTISSAVANEKHMTISRISAILRRFPRRTISRSAILLTVPRLESPFVAHRFCGSCGSGKPRRRDC